MHELLNAYLTLHGQIKEAKYIYIIYTIGLCDNSDKT